MGGLEGAVKWHVRWVLHLLEIIIQKLLVAMLLRVVVDNGLMLFTLYRIGSSGELALSSKTRGGC